MKTRFVVEAKSDGFSIFLWSLKEDKKTGDLHLDDCIYCSSNRAQVYGVLDSLLVTRTTIAEAEPVAPVAPVLASWPDNLLRMRNP